MCSSEGQSVASQSKDSCVTCLSQAEMLTLTLLNVYMVSANEHFLYESYVVTIYGMAENPHRS